MKIILKRLIANKQTTIGKLYIEGKEDNFVYTQECHQPTGAYGFITLLLPPCIIKAEIRKEMLEIEGVQVRAHWLFLERVHGFPNARIVITDNKFIKGGRISIGDTLIDEFNIGCRREAMIKLIRMLSVVGDEPTEVEFEVNDEDMEIHDYNESTYQDVQEELDKKSKSLKLLKEIYG